MPSGSGQGKILGTVNTWSSRLREDFQAGAVVAVFAVILSLSLGSLIFSSDLALGRGQGVGLALLSSIVFAGTIAWRSSYPATICIAQDRTAPIVALMAAQVAAGMPEDASPEAKCSAVFAAIALTTILLGGVLYLVGRFRLGNLFRFIPYPVVGGFLAGSGWLLALGAMRVMLGGPVSLRHLNRLITEHAWSKWLPGLVFGAVMYGLMRRFRRPLLLPMMLVLGVAGFHLVWALTGQDIAAARVAEWLPEVPAATGFHWQFWSFADLATLNPESYLTVAGMACTVVLTSLISILLNTSGLELLVHEEIDVNRELWAAGWANLVVGALGGFPGFLSLNLSRLANELGAKSRWAGLWVAALCALALFAGPGPMAILPKFVLGGLLFYLALGFLGDWVYDAWYRLPRADYAVVILILCVVGGVGYLEGVFVGVVAAVFLFIHKYSRIGVITHSFTGGDRQSNVERPLSHQRLLRERGGAIQVLKLHGFMFFGTSTGVLQVIRQRAADPTGAPLRFFILDGRQVTGIDSSATSCLSRARQLAVKRNFVLVLAQLSPGVRQQLKRSGFGEEMGPGYRVFPDLDHSLEWCEDQLLVSFAHELGESQDLPSWLAAIWPDAGQAQKFLAYLEPQSVEAGVTLIQQGDAADALYFLEDGEVTTRLELGSGRTQRLRRQRGGTVLGELGLFLGVPRTASVVTESPCRVYRLSRSALERLKHEEPVLSGEFHEFLVRYLSERVVNSNQTIRALAE